MAACGTSEPRTVFNRADERVERSEMDDPDARDRINAEKGRVEGLIHSLKGELGAENESDDAELSDYDQHPADNATDTFERERDLGLLDDLEAEFRELEDALGRIDAGTYGVDETTGEPIDPERLQALPAARTNVVQPDRPTAEPHDEAP
jgi:RNA polymerase-binding transcription factor DksA